MYVMLLVLFSLLFIGFFSQVINDKIDICANIECDNFSSEVCGIKTEGEGFRLKQFQSECDLYRFACKAGEEPVYDIISMYYCIQAFKIEPDSEILKVLSINMPCTRYNCSYPTNAKKVCGIKKDGDGFKVRLFENICHLGKYNCVNQVVFLVTDLHICSGMELQNFVGTINYENVDNFTMNHNISEIIEDPKDDLSINYSNTEADQIEKIVVVHSSLKDFNNVNASVDNFFAGTHVFDLPVKEINVGLLNEFTRRRQIEKVKPMKIFEPRVIIPKIVKEDVDHEPTLKSCYHKCPRKCPDTYAPVCGVPGSKFGVREPSLMFQNHCFMDVAQCKIFTEAKSPTAKASAYVEATFFFCLGDVMSSTYRFLPLIRTLQHMGRLRKKGHFRSREVNFKFFNQLLSRQPKLMG